jgi:hypothetical protein
VCGGGGTTAGADGRWATSRMRPPRMPPLPRGLLWNGSDLIANPLTTASPLTRRRSWVPFGFATYPMHKIGFRGAFALGAATAALSVMCMLVVTGVNDGVPILPASRGEWREVFEYGASIALAFGSGNILGLMAFQVLPLVLSQGGRPNALAFRIARLLSQHVGEEQLRRRARLIQDLLRTAGPLAGVVITALGSLYAGLKGVIGS